MDFAFTPEEDAFRAEVASFIEAHRPEEDPPSREEIAAWNAACAEQGYIGFHWPEEAGGRGASLIQQFILKEEMSARRAPPVGSDFMGLAWVGPALIRYGTEEQKRRYLPELLEGRSLWCTGYSEPDHGSDLASLQCRAERRSGDDGDEYVINGSKIWTTLAHAAKNIFLLVRTETDPSVSRYKGITCLLVPMDTPGIAVQPIPSLVGVHSFNQTFFDDVRVPVSCRLGEEGQGWSVVMGALAHERSGISEATEKLRHLEQLVELARRTRKRGRPALEDPGVRRQLAGFQARISAMRLNGMRHLTEQLKGRPPSSETSINKILRGQLEHAMWNLTLHLLGPEAGLDGELQRGALSYHGTVIGGGSPNIQRNIISERILGLPKD